ncbi:MAG TPA: hypothetical protein VHI98_00535 [Vicinamibacterales bacterium]|nr:hypothetical protein [Vicinamibacterales bacterium]
MTGRAIDRTISRGRFEVLHSLQLLIDHAVHPCHLARGALRPLFVAREVRLDVTMSALHTESATVPPVHDAKKRSRLDCLQPGDLDVFEDLRGRFVLAPLDPVGELFHETGVHVLILLGVGAILKRRHGEDGPRKALRDRIRQQFGLSAEMPAYRDIIEF